jgi:hypothetical protein
MDVSVRTLSAPPLIPIILFARAICWKLVEGYDIFSNLDWRIPATLLTWISIIERWKTNRLKRLTSV